MLDAKALRRDGARACEVRFNANLIGGLVISAASLRLGRMREIAEVLSSAAFRRRKRTYCYDGLEASEDEAPKRLKRRLDRVFAFAGAAKTLSPQILTRRRRALDDALAAIPRG
jgi:hypothetical protein